MRPLELSQKQKQKAEWWFPGTEEPVANGQFPLGKRQRGTDMERGAGGEGSAECHRAEHKGVKF